MFKSTLFPLGLALLVATALLCGCSDSNEPAPSSDATMDGHDMTDGHGHDMTSAPEDDAKKEEMLADLSPEDRAAVEKQKICPVGGGPLWGMGKPYKITVTTGAGAEREVFLCCASCEDAIRSEPDKYLAKIDP